MDVEPAAQRVRLGIGLILSSVLIGLHQMNAPEPEPAPQRRKTREYKETVVAAYLHFRALQHRKQFRSMVRMDPACFDTLYEILAPELGPARMLFLCSSLALALVHSHLWSS